jgi:hypothetical protein
MDEQLGDGHMAKRAAKKAKHRKRGNGSHEYAFVDAKKPFTIHVTWDDIHAAVPGDSRNCVLSRAGRREHNCFDVVVYRHIAYVRKSERSIPLRYQVTQPAYDLLVAFDASGRSHPITVTFVPPRPGLRASHLRSPQRIAAAKASRERTKKKQEQRAAKTGRRRRYTKPDPLTLFGVRNGAGQRPFSKVPGA